MLVGATSALLSLVPPTYYSCAPAASLRRHALPCATLPSGGDQQKALVNLLQQAGIVDEPERVEELSAGFCNWVYRVDLPERADADACSMLVKVFSPLAKLRISPPQRGQGDERAGEGGLGPRLHFRSADGLISDFVQGSTLSEPDIHARSPWLLRRIAKNLAELHSLALPRAVPDDTGRPPVVLWQFLHTMLAHVSERPETVPSGVHLQQVVDEVERMRSRFDELGLPVVLGHGDLKPSNVMTLSPHARDAAPRLSSGVCFIDFELAGAHYRGHRS